MSCAMFIASAWCICAPLAPQAVAAPKADHSCCETKSAPTPIKQPAQDCPSCSWGVLRSARLLPADHHLATPFDFSAAIFTAPVYIALPAIEVAPESLSRNTGPPPDTLVNLHCLILS